MIINIKKIIMLVGVITLLEIGLNANVIELSSPDLTDAGNTFTINIIMNLSEPVKTIAFDLLFDPEVFTALSVEGGFINTSCTAAGGTPSSIINIDNTTGKISFSETCLGGGKHINGSGNVAVITFNSSSAGSGIIALQNIEIQKVINFTEYHLPYSFKGPSNKTVTIKTCDLNNDGIVIRDYNDLMAAYKCFVGIGSDCVWIKSKNWGDIKEEYECFTKIN